MKIYPAILESDRDLVEEKITLVKDLVERVQLDVIDGLFADNLTVTPEDVAKIDWGDLGVDVHLMVDDPMEWIEACLSLPKVRIIAQVERLGSQSVFVDWVRGYREVEGIGLGLDKDTPIEALDKEVLDQVSVVVLLAVRAGFQGQVFDEKVKVKIKQLRKIFNGEIVIDGGVGISNIKQLEELKVDGVAIGSYLWQSKDVRKQLIKLRERVTNNEK